jgi:hypothetical protein
MGKHIDVSLQAKQYQSDTFTVTVGEEIDFIVSVRSDVPVDFEHYSSPREWLAFNGLNFSFSEKSSNIVTTTLLPDSGLDYVLSAIVKRDLRGFYFDFGEYGKRYLSSELPTRMYAAISATPEHYEAYDSGDWAFSNRLIISVSE